MPKISSFRTMKTPPSCTYFLYYTLCTRLLASPVQTRSQVFDEGDVVEVPNYQYLCLFIISRNRSTGKLSRKKLISTGCRSLGHLALLALLAFRAYSVLVQARDWLRSKGRMPSAVPGVARTWGMAA